MKETDEKKYNEMETFHLWSRWYHLFNRMHNASYLRRDTLNFIIYTVYHIAFAIQPQTLNYPHKAKLSSLLTVQRGKSIDRKAEMKTCWLEKKI